jgi:hypothetical protein
VTVVLYHGDLVFAGRRLLKHGTARHVVFPVIGTNRSGGAECVSWRHSCSATEGLT